MKGEETKRNCIEKLERDGKIQGMSYMVWEEDERQAIRGRRIGTMERNKQSERKGRKDKGENRQIIKKRKKERPLKGVGWTEQTGRDSLKREVWQRTGGRERRSTDGKENMEWTRLSANGPSASPHDRGTHTQVCRGPGKVTGPSLRHEGQG